MHRPRSARPTSRSSARSSACNRPRRRRSSSTTATRSRGCSRSRASASSSWCAAHFVAVRVRTTARVSMHSPAQALPGEARSVARSCAHFGMATTAKRAKVESMRTPALFALVLSLASGGCVTKSVHDATLRDLAAARRSALREASDNADLETQLRNDETRLADLAGALTEQEDLVSALTVERAKLAQELAVTKEE